MKAALLIAALALVAGKEAEAQQQPPDIRFAVQNMIYQLQTGQPNPQMYGPELWATISMQTGNSGIYLPLRDLGQATDVRTTGYRQLPLGWLYSVQASHQLGESTWLVGLNSYTNRIEYANFNVATGGAQPAPMPLPRAPDPAPSPGGEGDPPSSGGSGGESEACRKFPNLC